MENKILIDVERLRYPISGVANVAKYLILGLSELDAKNVSLFGPKEIINTFKTNFEVVNWKSVYKLYFPFQRKYDIIHVTQQLSNYFHHKSSNQKKIVTLHDFNFLHENHSTKKIKKTINKINKNLRNADVVVCISEFVKQDYLKNKYLIKTNKDQKVIVIYNGLQFPESTKVYDLGKFSFLKNKRYFLNIGVLFPKKNQLSILKSLPFIDEDFVMVVSDSKKEYEDEILEFINKNNLQNRVHILKYISDEEKYALLQNCTAMIHPSLAEGFGIPPIEAMYFGKPIFLSKFTSLPEIGGKYAFYFDSFNTEEIVETIKNGMLLYQNDIGYSVKLKSHALQFDYKIMAKNYLNLYQSIS